MKRRLAVLLVVWALLGQAPAWAHRLDEYLQATIVSLDPGTVSLTMRLVPGVAVSSRVIGLIDRDGDGVVSEAEETAYTQRVISELELTEDGRPLPLRVVRMSFPAMAQMRAGIGEITLALAAELSPTEVVHQLSFDNRHESAISVYLVNVLVPEDARFGIVSQERNRNQSVYALSFTTRAAASTAASRAQGFHWSGFGGAFRLGMRHIAEGTDHLLFLLTLLLPAPLLAVGGRWGRASTVRGSLVHILGIVTAFTLGHSLTLALSAFGLVQLPSSPVEVLIAVSILVSAVHALRPVFPGKEAAIAGFFGLIHGLAFASALNELGMTGWYRLVSLLGFNAGIEAMQLLVVLVTLPSLLLLSRTRWYGPFRVLGGSVAGCASMTWIFERMTDRASGFSPAAEEVARHGGLMAAMLFALSGLAWFSRNSFERATAKESKVEA